jgi:two-component system cell cycle response regulator
LTRLQSAPFEAATATGGDPQRAKAVIEAGKATVNETLAELEQRSPPPELALVSEPLRANYAAVGKIYELGITVGYGREAYELATLARGSAEEIAGMLETAAAEYHGRASLARYGGLAGLAATIIILAGAFVFFYSRSGRLVLENDALLEAARKEALTDALTGLGNRRALIHDLEEKIPAASAESELLLALFDLDGFKEYNDSFGHPAGDSLLSRLGGRLADAADGIGVAYRMGGDEFCLLVEIREGGAEAVRLGAKALSTSGDAFEIGCSFGTVLLPTEATVPADALRISDQRMYANKAARGSASRQSTDVLLKVLDERSPGILDHVQDVVQLADLTGQELGLDEGELARIQPAAELHDVGKSAIPDAVLNKPGKLDAAEWAFMRRHTIIGERIVLAAPSLAHTGSLIRSSHERVDGTGYPDGLIADQIPLGARIIAVCDAYAAMTSERPYSEAMSAEEALAELRRCAGSQFDAEVVTAFCAVAERVALPPVAVSA